MFLIQSHEQISPVPIRARLRSSLGQYTVRDVLKGCSLDQMSDRMGNQQNMHAIIIRLQYIDDTQRSFEHCLWAVVGGGCAPLLLLLFYVFEFDEAVFDYTDTPKMDAHTCATMIGRERQCTCACFCYTPSCTPTRTLPHSHSQRNACTHTHTQTHTNTHVHSHTHTHTHTYAKTLTHRHTHMRKHTHTPRFTPSK